MKLSQIPGKVVNKVSAEIKLALGKDPLTGIEIEKGVPLRRIGKNASWVVPKDMLDETSICYLAGAGENITFDLGLVNLFNCKSFIFDPTPRAKFHFDNLKKNISKEESTDVYSLTHYNEANISFHEIGIWDKETTIKFYAPKNPNHVSHSIVNLQKTDNYFEAKVDRLSSLMKKLNHTKIDLLKLDIEGAEYTVLDTIIEDQIDIPIICIEFDEAFNALDDQYVERIKSQLMKFKERGYIIVNVDHPGNYTLIKRSK